MRRLVTLAVLAFVLVFATPARAADEPILGATRGSWPTEISKRPLTLGTGMAEVSLPVNVDLSDGADAQPVFLNPSIAFGVTDRLTVAVRHFLGVCLSGENHGCPDVYNDLSLGALLSIGRTSGIDAAVGVALNLAPITDNTALAGEGRLVLRGGTDAFALTIAPTLNVGVNDRDVRRKRYGVPMNFGTYDVLLPEEQPENREVLLIPGTLQFQVAPNLAVAASASLNGPISPRNGGYGDYYTVPVGFAAVLTPLRYVDVGAALTFPNLLGKNNTADRRLLSVFLALRT